MPRLSQTGHHLVLVSTVDLIPSKLRDPRDRFFVAARD